ncbi:MAG: hypothetical protein AB7F88_00065 [Pyrinomonadaceae bacterium]
MAENENVQELHIESREAGDKTATLVIEGVPGDVYQNPETIHKILDALEMPKGTSVRVNLKASSSVVR